MSNQIISETPNYAIVIVEVKSDITPEGRDRIYAVVNKDSSVIEARNSVLPIALQNLKTLQAALEAVTKGEDVTDGTGPILQ